MLTIRFLSSSHKLKKGESFAHLPEPRLAAARGETLCFQAVLTSGEDETVFVSGAPACEIFWERYVTIPQPSCSYYEAGDYPDVLVDNASAEKFGENVLRANEAQFLFIQVPVPRFYGKKTLSFTLNVKGKAAASAKISAEIYPFALPEQVHAASSFAVRDDMIFGTQEEKYEKYDGIYQELLKYRVAAASVALPFSERAEDIPYLVERYKKAAADDKVPSYSINYTTRREDTIFQKNQEVLDKKFLKDILTAMAEASTAELDLFKKAYFYITFIDEPTPERFHSVTRVYDEYYKILREVSAECDFTGKENVRASLNALPNVVTVFNKEPIYGQVDTWCPTFFAYSKPEYVYEEKHLRRLGKKNWWYGCMAPWHPILNYHTDSPAADARFEPWLRYKYDIAGNLFWAVNLTKRYDSEKQAYVPADILNEPIAFCGVNGDGLLLYTETYYGKVLPSYRMMSIFEGNQDYEYFYLFDRHVKALEKECGVRLDPRASLKPIFDEIAAGAALVYRAGAEELKAELATHVTAAEDGVFVLPETERGEYKISVYCAEGVTLSGMERVRLGNAYKAETRLPFGRKTTFFTLKYTVNGSEVDASNVGFRGMFDGRGHVISGMKIGKTDLRGGFIGILNGVANGGFTQGNVSAEWSLSVGGAGSPLTNDEDKLTVNCERSSGGAYPNTANTPYASELTAEGNYLIVISDRAGNSTSYTFSIDRSAPVLELEGDNGGYTNGNVSAGWDTTAGGVRTQRMNDSDVLTVLYARSDSKDFPSSAEIEYAGALTAEGNYLIVISDSAGNSTAYKFTIDKTAPTLSLLGTENGGFTREAVSSEWSSSVGGIGSQLTNDGDRLSVMYARSDGGEYPTSATQAYAKALTAEGNYLLVITDRAGNNTKYTFTIDVSAPVLALDGTSDGDFTNGDVGVEWQTTVGGVGAQRTHANDALTVMYARSETKDFPAAAETAYTGTFSQEGNYLVTISDRAGNSRSYTFTIDKTAPTLEFDTVENGGATKEDTAAVWDTAVGGVGAPRTNGKDSLVVKYDFYDGATFPETANKDYSGTFTVQGRYLVTITDRAGNSTSYTFTLDKTAPVLQVNADMVGSNSVYGGTPSVTWSDNYLSVAEVGITLAELAVSPQAMTAGEPYGVEAGYGDKLTESGVYTVTLTDDVGNESVVSFAVVGAVNSYNRDRMENSGYLKTGNYRVKIPYMKTVTVPATGKDGKKSVYPGAWSNANTYVFASYENALRFMMEVEMEEAVTYNGNGVYTYYQINNHSATTTYGDGDGARATMEEFYMALEKYSLAYVSEYSVPSLNSPYVGNNTVIMDSEVLAGTTQDGVQRVGGDYVFANKTYSIAFGRQTFAYDSLTRLKIEQGGRTVYDGALQSGADLLKYIGSDSASGATGGVYTVTETDGLGNTLIYEVYFDRTAPTFLAQYTYYHAFTDGEGDMQSEVLSAELELSSNLQIDGNLRTLSVQKLLDNSDEIITAVVVRPDGTTLTTFDLSILTFGAGGNFTDGGEYHVKLYDRTGNVFDYVFTIYGGAPRVQSQIRGTGDNRSITISFANANSYSSIVRFAIYRYGVRLPDGEYNETVDGKVLNTLYIEQDVWSYRFVLGGVYTVRFEDSFGNVTESDEIVFSKGLPDYTLSGVTEGGKTRKSVSLVFESSAGYEVYKDGEIMTIPANAVTDGQEIEIAATEENNGTWEIKLYVKSDPNTYVTVRFTLDTVAPTAAAENEKGAPIAWDTTTQEGFRIVWSDTDVERVRYQIDNGLSKTYTAGELLTEDGVYTISYTATLNNRVVTSDEYAIKVGDVVAPNIDVAVGSINGTRVTGTTVSANVGDTFDFASITVNEPSTGFSYTKELIDPNNSVIATLTSRTLANNGSSYTLGIAGQYRVEYTVTDDAGNSTVVKYTIVVSSSSSTSPSSGAVTTLAVVLIIVGVLLVAGVVIYLIRFRRRKPNKR